MANNFIVKQDCYLGRPPENCQRWPVTDVPSPMSSIQAICKGSLAFLHSKNPGATQSTLFLRGGEGKATNPEQGQLGEIKNAKRFVCPNFFAFLTLVFPANTNYIQSKCKSSESHIVRGQDHLVKITEWTYTSQGGMLCTAVIVSLQGSSDRVIATVTYSANVVTHLILLSIIPSWFFKTGFLCIALTVLALTLQTRLALNSQIHCLYLPSAGIKGVHHHRLVC